MDEINKFRKELKEFAKDRNWEQYHNLKDLALSLNLEASELLECFQWKSPETALNENKQDIIDELADVLIYAMHMANQLDIDVMEAIRNKFEKVKIKYPVEKAYGKATKYNKL